MTKSVFSTQHSAIVVARLTITRQDNARTIVEIRSDATFHGFYHFFKQQGRRRSTKQEFRTASRNEYLPVVNAHRNQPGLDVIERQLRKLFAESNPVTESRLRIIKKRAYKRLITISASELGLSKIHTVDLSHRARRLAVRSPRALPVGAWLKSLPAELQVG